MLYQSQNTITQNAMSWTGIVDMIYVDQPGMIIPVEAPKQYLISENIKVGVGFSTSESDGYSMFNLHRSRPGHANLIVWYS